MIRRGTWIASTALLIGMSIPARLHACATCFGASDSPMAQGMNMGIMVLLGVIGFVLLSVASFFGFLAWRMSRLSRARGSVEIT